jgi:uncharacterized protein YraI
MKKLLFGSIATLALTSLTFPSQAQAEAYFTACTKDYYSSVNLRTGPSRSYPIVASIPNRAPVRILSWVWGGDNMRWVRVENSGLVGFAREDYLCF